MIKTHARPLAASAIVATPRAFFVGGKDKGPPRSLKGTAATLIAQARARGLAVQKMSTSGLDLVFHLRFHVVTNRQHENALDQAVAELEMPSHTARVFCLYAYGNDHLLAVFRKRT